MLISESTSSLANGKNGLYELAKKLKLAGKVRFISLSGHRTNIAIQAIKDGVVDVLMHPSRYQSSL